jgi:hypothetical protein
MAQDRRILRRQIDAGRETAQALTRAYRKGLTGDALKREAEKLARALHSVNGGFIECALAGVTGKGRRP